MTIPEIVTLEQVQAHLRLSPMLSGSPPMPGSPAEDDPDLSLKLLAATQLVCEFIADRKPPDPEWVAEIESWTTAFSSSPSSPSTVAPPIIKLAILEQVAEFYRFRGDDPKQERPEVAGYLTPTIANLLMRYRSPMWA